MLSTMQIGVRPANIPEYDCYRQDQNTTATIFQIDLTADTRLTLRGYAVGELVLVRMTQDAAGGHLVNWTGAVFEGDPALLVPNPLAGASTDVVLVCRTDGSFVIIGASGSGSGNGEIFLVSNGVDDTVQITAVLNAGLVAVLGPVNGTFFVDGTNPLTHLSAPNLGGLILLPGVTIEPVAGWIPLVGSADDRTSAFFQISGALTAYTSTQTLKAARGLNYDSGIVATAGLAAGQFVRRTASPTVGSDLLYADIVQVANVLSGTEILTVNQHRMYFGASHTTLPTLLRGLVPVQSFFIEAGPGAGFSTLGRNIACALTLTDCYATEPGSIHFDGLQFFGFSRAAIDMRNCDGVETDELVDAGLNMGLVFLDSCHGTKHQNARTNPLGAPVHTAGIANHRFKSMAGGSDNKFLNLDGTGSCGLVHCQGGWANVIVGLRGRFFQADLLPLTNALYTATPYGVLFQGDYGPLNVAEFGYEYQIDDLSGAESYTALDWETVYPINPWFVYLHDLLCCTVGDIQAAVAGPGYGAVIHGVATYPVPAVNISQLTGTTIDSISTKGTGALLVSEDASDTTIGLLAAEGSGGDAGGLGAAFAIIINTSGRLPTIGKCLLNSGNFIVFSPIPIGAQPDFLWQIDTLEFGFGKFQNVKPVRDAGVLASRMVAQLDPASPAGVTRVVVPAANANSVVIIAMGNESGLGAIKLAGFAGEQLVSAAGATNCGDVLVASGGAGNTAAVSVVATASNKLAKALQSSGGAAVIRCWI